MLYEILKKTFRKKNALSSMTPLSATVDKKRRKTLNNKIALFCIGTNFIAVFLFLSLSGCATNKTVIPDVPVSPAQQYKYFLDQEGLSIAIDPFFEEERIRLYFGGDLLSRGILPVLIIVENNDNKAVYLLERNSIQLQDSQQGVPDRAAYNREPAISYPVRPLNVFEILGNPLAFAHITLTVRALSGNPVMKPDVDNKVVLEANTLNENLKKNAFVDRTVFPNERHSGFVYFQIKGSDDLKNILAIVVKAKNIRFDKDLSFDYKFKNEVKRK